MDFFIMGNISSIHFERSKKHNTGHNDRTVKPKYLLGDNFECNLSYRDAENFYSELLNNSSYAYTKRTGQKPQYREENLRWSAVVNIKPDTTMQDLEKLASHFNKKYGFQCYQIAMHKDEGEPLFVDEEKKIPKLDKDGKQIYKPNLHAHLEFLMLNEQGITCFKKKDFGIKKMKEIQTEVAEILGMERGKENSKAERLTHQQFKQEQKRIHEAKLEVKKELEEKHEQDIKENYISKKDVKAEIEKARKEWIKEQGHTKEDYDKLKAFKDQNFNTIEELKLKIKELEDEIKERKKNDELIEKVGETLFNIGEVLKVEDTKDPLEYLQNVENQVRKNVEDLTPKPVASKVTAITLEEMKPQKVESGIFGRKEEPGEVILRVNKRLQSQIVPFMKYNAQLERKIKDQDAEITELKDKNDKLEHQNESWKTMCLNLLKDLGITIRKNMTETLKSFDIFRKKLAWGSEQEQSEIINNVGRSAFRESVDYYQIEKKQEEQINNQLEQQMGTPKEEKTKEKTEEHGHSR